MSHSPEWSDGTDPSFFNRGWLPAQMAWVGNSARLGCFSSWSPLLLSLTLDASAGFLSSLWSSLHPQNTTAGGTDIPGGPDTLAFISSSPQGFFRRHSRNLIRALDRIKSMAVFPEFLTLSVIRHSTKIIRPLQLGIKSKGTC